MSRISVVIRHMGDCPHGRSEPTEDDDEIPIADEYDDSGLTGARRVAKERCADAHLAYWDLLDRELSEACESIGVEAIPGPESSQGYGESHLRGAMGVSQYGLMIRAAAPHATPLHSPAFSHFKEAGIRLWHGIFSDEERICVEGGHQSGCRCRTAFSRGGFSVAFSPTRVP